MPNSLIFNAPFNNLSFGQVSYNIARELFKKDIDTYILPFGQPNLAAYPKDDVASWIKAGCERGLKKFNREIPTLKMWHIQGSEQSPSKRQVLFTFHETDEPTAEEINIVNQQDFTFFSSTYSRDNFADAGAQNVGNVGLGFDSDILKDGTSRKASPITHWILVGKCERRKNTAMILKTWVKKYGKNPRHSLTAVIFNPFLHQRDPHAHEKMLAAVFEGKPKPFNVQIFNPLQTNVEINQLYNNADIDLSGFSNAEGWGLPAFNMTALGKWSIVTNCSSHTDWATKENSILVNPIGKQPCYDDVHFFKGHTFNQGNVFAFTEDQLSNAMDIAAQKAKTVNTEGVILREKFTYAKTVETLLEKVL